MSGPPDQEGGRWQADEATEALTLALNQAKDGQDDALRPGRRIGRYLIEAQLGQGGMGTVFLAEQTEPVRRPVAIKISRRRRLTNEERLNFERERQALAQLQHPGIAQIFDMGALDDGTPFFVMEYVPGQTLLEFCRQADLSIRERVNLLRLVCAGVNHAHQRGLIHCDLKPSNILVSRVDGQPQPKIIDFGTARLLNQAGIGENLYGTLAYMAPEQAEQDAPTTTRVDVFSLGAMLFELLSDQALRQIETPDQVPPLSELRALLLQSTRRGPFEPVKAVTRSRLRELCAIIERATSADPESRYDSASGLADELQRWLDRQPVRALPQSRRYRLARFLSRNSLASTLAAATLLGLVGGLTGTTFGLFEAQEQRRLAESRQADLERVVSFQQDLLTELDMNELADRMRDRLAETAGQLVLRDGGDASAAADARSQAQSTIEGWAPVDAARDLVVEGILGQANELIAERYADNPEVAAALRVSLAQTLLAWQAFDAADSQIEKARTYYASVGDRSSRNALEADTEAVKLLWWRQHFPDAFELVRTIRPRAEASLGPNDDLSLYLLRAETSLSSFVEGAAVAVDSGRILVRRLTELRGASHPDTLRAEGDLLNNRSKSRSICPDELIADFLDHLQRARGLKASDRQRIAVSSMNLGTCLAQNGQLARAVDWMENATEVGRATLGERHTITMMALNDRAFYLLLLGRLQEAEAVVESLYANQQAIYGNDTAYLIYPRSYLAYLNGAGGRAQEAIASLTGMLAEAAQDPELPPSFMVWIHRLISWTYEDALNDLERAHASATAGLDSCRKSPLYQREYPELCLLEELEVLRLTGLRDQSFDVSRLELLLSLAQELHPQHFTRSLAAWLAYRFSASRGSSVDLKDRELSWLLDKEPEMISIIQQRIVEDLRSGD